MAEHKLALAVNGREGLMRGRLVAFAPADVPVQQRRGQDGGDPDGDVNGAADSDTNTDANAGHDTDGDRNRPRLGTVAVIGLGYVGLPTALALYTRCDRVIGVDISQGRLRAVASGDVDLPEADRLWLAEALATGWLQLTTDSGAISEADAVIICVPTPVDQQHVPDLTALSAACGTVVERARAGQTIVLTSTTFVGTTRDMLVEPLKERGLVAGEDIYVAFSPERIDPGNPDHAQRHTPRVVGGTTPACAQHAAQVIGLPQHGIAEGRPATFVAVRADHGPAAVAGVPVERRVVVDGRWL